MSSFYQKNKAILTIYRNYQKTIDSVNIANKIFDRKRRKPNFPEYVSEYVVFLCIYIWISPTVFVGKTGDLMDIENEKTLRYEVKAFSSNGPMSFGPKENWDCIFFLDVRKHPYYKLYYLDMTNKDKIWKNIIVNKNETFEMQCKEKRRPRISFELLAKQIKIPLLDEGNIYDLLSLKIN